MRRYTALWDCRLDHNTRHGALQSFMLSITDWQCWEVRHELGKLNLIASIQRLALDSYERRLLMPASSLLDLKRPGESNTKRGRQVVPVTWIHRLMCPYTIEDGGCIDRVVRFCVHGLRHTEQAITLLYHPLERHATGYLVCIQSISDAAFVPNLRPVSFSLAIAPSFSHTQYPTLSPHDMPSLFLLGSHAPTTTTTTSEHRSPEHSSPPNRPNTKPCSRTHTNNSVQIHQPGH